MEEVIVVGAQERDRRAGAVEHRRLRFAGPDLDEEGVDPAALAAELERVPAAGIVGTKDRAALLAAIVARRRGLPGPDPEAVVACQHKPTSRAIQRRVAPEATPLFAPLDGVPPFPPPWFVKPAVGRLSQEARRVEDDDGLARLTEDARYRDGWASLAALALTEPPSAHGFLVEELLGGDEVTLEGYVHGGRATVIGVTDSLKYEATNSFEAFAYPSALPDERLAALDDLAHRLVAGHGLDACFFNVELFVPRAGRARTIEINARIASQFAPLVTSVHGRSTYDALAALACGEDPAWAPGTPEGVAVSYVLRVFEDAFVESVPDAEEGLEILVRPGIRLSEQGHNDTASYRLAIFTEHGTSREEVLSRCRRRARSLPFVLSAVGEERRH
jgi:ATP-grasp domain-containing protein